MSSDPRLHLGHLFEGAVPAQFQLRGHQTILRIAGVVLAKSPIRGKARGFEVARQSIADLVTLLCFLPLRLQGGLNRRRLDDS